MTPAQFAAELEALVAKYGSALNDNQVITTLEAQLTRSWADACEPQPEGLFSAAPAMLQALRRNRAALDLIDPVRPLQYAMTMDLMRRDMSAAIAKAEGRSND